MTTMSTDRSKTMVILFGGPLDRCEVKVYVTEAASGTITVHGIGRYVDCDGMWCWETDHRRSHA